MADAVVVGGGISGIACASALASAGVAVRVRDRGRRLAGRMTSRRLRDTGTAFDGRPVDIGASYFTASDPAFIDAVEQLIAREVVQPWTTSFHVAGPDGIVGVSTGPMRYRAAAGLSTVVEALLVDGIDVSLGDEVSSVEVDGRGVTVDGAPADLVAACLPDPQLRRLTGAVPAAPVTWEPVIAVTCVFDERSWIDLDGVFVNDDPVLTWIADDGRRRADDAPVLVAHVNPVLAALHLQDPAAVIPLAVATLRRVLGIDAMPDWVDAHRWTYAKPLAAAQEPFWMHEQAPFGVAGDAWADGPRVEAAWLSGHCLGRALADRAGGV
jgi:renalase